ncbi:MAG: helix-turn-helix domain-containing protein, partial [Nostoc sp.]|uniref:helix-turn-helix domain-containing protein n=1 Tax=Nostoc sp. TaxID=1180 RepID=UPI002FFB485E
PQATGVLPYLASGNGVCSEFSVLTNLAVAITYGQNLREAAEKLGVSLRTVQRLVKNWEQDGLVGLTQTGLIKENIALVNFGKPSSSKLTRRVTRVVNV